MEDSAEMSNKLHGQAASVPHFRFYSPIIHSLLQALMAIFRFKLQHPRDFWKPYRPVSSSQEDSRTGGSDLPSTVTADGSGLVTSLSRDAPRPDSSCLDGSQTNHVSRPCRSRGRGSQTN